MSKYIIEGGSSLYGTASIGGAKNSVLPILAGTVLAAGESIIHNCPCIRDVELTLEILKCLGCGVKMQGNTAIVDAGSVTDNYIPMGLMNKMRSSVIFMGAILSRTGEARCSYPGGCELGARPINLHLKSFKQLGVEITEQAGFLECRLEKYKPGTVQLDFPSVGATENIMLLACGQEGTTTIVNAAREPEIADLQDLLIKMGAKIRGADEGIIEIEGVKSLKPVEKTVISDRICAATILFMVAAAGGCVELKNVNTTHIESIISVLRGCGADIRFTDDGINIKVSERIDAVDILQTMPYPGYPTDAQPQLMAALCTANGTSVIKETIFENRFKAVGELKKMGADITLGGEMAIIRGVKNLHGASLSAPDLRAGAALVIAALAAEGRSEISGVCYIDRGYENLEGMVTDIGGKIIRV